MARARNIKPAFFKNETLVELPFEHRLLFVGLWTLADKAGRLEDRPKRIKMELFPADNVDVEQGLALLEKHGFIKRYSAKGFDIVQVLAFAKHQTPHHTEKASELPDINGEITVKPPKQDGGNPPDSLIPDSLIPDSLIPESLQPPAATAVSVCAEGKPSTRKPKPEAKTEQAWEAYSREYQHRYGVVPVRNAKVNGQLAQIVARLGAEDAPHVAAFFVHHNSSWYVSKGHAVGLLLNDAEKLRTEWATGRKVTSIAARQIEKTQAGLDSHNEALAILQAKGHAL
jgi:hypothetical protein